MPRSALIRTVLSLACLGLASAPCWAEPETEPAASPKAAEKATRPKVKKAPHWYKGNLHTHSVWSDGNEFPEIVADWYKTHGYDFLSLTDHNFLSVGERWREIAKATGRGNPDAVERCRARFGEDWIKTRSSKGKEEFRLKTLEEIRAVLEEKDKFLLIQGEEITDECQSLPIHVNGINLSEVIRPQGGATVRETIANDFAAVAVQRQQAGHPIIAQLNHPNFGYAVTAEDMAAVARVRFFEVGNGHPEVRNEGDREHAGIERMWDIANAIRLGKMKAAPLFATATDDAHNFASEEKSIPGRGWVVVRSTVLEPDAIVAAMERGDFYASSGITLKRLDFSVHKQVLSVEVQPEQGVEYTIDFIGTLKDADLSSKPALDRKGQSLRTTETYSPDVGRLLASIEGTSAKYYLTGEELYVRAVVRSNKTPEFPVTPGQVQKAWTQPVGWQKWVKCETASEP